MQRHSKTITPVAQLRMKIYTQRDLRWVDADDVGAGIQSRSTMLVVNNNLCRHIEEKIRQTEVVV